MNHEQINRYSAAIHRCIFLLKLLNSEIQYLFSFKTAPSGIRKEISFLAPIYQRGIDRICTHIPTGKQKFLDYHNASEQKISAIGNILEKLAALDEEEILELEQEFINQVKIDYKGA